MSTPTAALTPPRRRSSGSGSLNFNDEPDNPPHLTSTPNSSVDVTPTSTLAFNGGTFVRPNRKHRKGLAFITNGQQDADADVPSSGAKGGGGNAKTETKPSASSSSPGSLSPPHVILTPVHGDGGPVSVSSSSGIISSGNGRMKGSPTTEESCSSFSGGTTPSHSHSLSTNSEENFECFGEGSSVVVDSLSFLDLSNNANTNANAHHNGDHHDGNLRSDSDLLLDSSPQSQGVAVGVEDASKRGSLTRNGWQRTSLRKTPTTGATNGEGMSNHRRWGSFRNSGGKSRGAVVVPSTNALANQLYRSSSYHSSGRSSAGDGEEMYSDSSLEGEVIDLTKKVHHLEEKFTVLAENQHDVDDRYSRAKQENAELKTKLFMLEEQIRDVEQRSEEKLREEGKRHKDTTTRIEREKQLQLENLEIKLQMMEKDLAAARIESKRLEGAFERERNENNYLTDKVSGLDRELGNIREENRELLAQNRVDRETMAQENVGSQQALADLKNQLESLSHFHMNGGSSNNYHNLRRNDSSDPSELRSRLNEAEEEIKRLKLLNNQLEEINEELNAQMLNQRLEDGRNLLKNTCTVSSSGGNSLAAEFEAMSNEDRDEYGISSKIQSEKEALTKMRTALKDQKESNFALRAYIDNILLNIVEHYPQLLEVKHKSSNNGNGVSSH